MAKALTKNCFVVLLCCGALCVCAGCEKGGKAKGQKEQFKVDKFYERGPLAVHVRVDKDKITIADTVLMEFEATIKSGYEVQMPKVDKVLEHFGIVDWDNIGDRLDANDNLVRTYQYRLEPFLSGKYQLPAFTFEFHDANEPQGKEYQLTTEPIDIEVTSLLGEQRSKLQIADIEGVIDMPKEHSYWWMWLLLAAAVLGFAGFFYVRRKRRVESIRILKPAHEIAYERLRDLVNEDLVGAGRLKEFYERISNILRHYIEHRFDLRAPERTTEEFLIEIQRADVLLASHKESLARFLRHCDLVKFANVKPTTEQIQQTFDLVKDFIEKTKSDQTRVDVTDQAEVQQVVEVESS